MANAADLMITPTGGFSDRLADLLSRQASEAALALETMSLSWLSSPNTIFKADFAGDRYFANGALTSFMRAFPSFARNSESLDSDPVTGLSTIIAANKPSRGKSGLFVGSARTNGNMETDSPTPGGLVYPDLPYWWDAWDATKNLSLGPALDVNVLTREPIRGQPRTRLRVKGIPQVTGGLSLYPMRDGFPSIAAALNQHWVANWPISLVAGSTDNVTFNMGVVENDNAAHPLGDTKNAFVPDGSPLGTKRYHAYRQLLSGSVAYAQGFLTCLMTAGLPVDFTLDLGRQTFSQGRYPFPIDIRSNGGAGARAADSVVSNAIASWLGSGLPFTVVVKAKAPLGVGAANQYLFQFSDGTGNNAVAVLRGTGKLLNAFVVTGGVVQADRSSAIVENGADFGVCVSFENNNVKISLNGADPLVDNSTPNGLPASLTRLAICSELGSAQFWDSFIKSIEVISGATSDAQMKVLSAA